ncbi:MAG: LysM peptidoglycan-binding domain-containing protein [Candidatus Puniceispirillaceae bacterium]
MLNSLRLLALIACLGLLSACESASERLSSIDVPSLSLPDLSLTRETPAPVVNAPLRVNTRTIPVSRQITVSQGETIYAIATIYGVSPDYLIRLNDLQPPFALSAGQTLRIEPARFHEVQLGDSLFSIAQRYAVSQYQLAELNGLSAPYELVQGQRLNIPASHDFTILDAAMPRNAGAVKPAERLAETQNQQTQNQQTNNTANASLSQAGKPSAPRKNFVAPKLTSNSAFSWPVEGQVSNEFGPAARGVHNDGIDILAAAGTPVSVIAPGTVAYVGEGLRGFGTLVLVKHDGGYISAYAHLASASVAEGDVLSRAARIGAVGQTGSASQPMLHFEVRKGRTPIDPRSIIGS